MNLYRLAWYKVHYPTDTIVFLSNIFKAETELIMMTSITIRKLLRNAGVQGAGLLEADKEKSDSQLFFPKNRNIRLPLNNKQYFADDC